MVSCCSNSMVVRIASLIAVICAPTSSPCIASFIAAIAAAADASIVAVSRVAEEPTRSATMRECADT